MEGVETPYPFGLMLPQSETERLLEERLHGLGVDVERRVELASFQSHADGVESVLRHPDGHEEAVSTDWLVGCDGAHSAVRHGLNAPFVGETMDSDWMLADVHMTGYPFPDSEVSVYWHRDGVFVIFPISPGRYRVIADLPPAGGEHPPTPTMEQVQAIMDRRGPSGLEGVRPDLARGLPDQRPQGRELSLGARLPRGRRGARPQPRGRPGHEHRDAGRVQPAGSWRWSPAGRAPSTCSTATARSAAASATRS